MTKDHQEKIFSESAFKKNGFSKTRKCKHHGILCLSLWYFRKSDEAFLCILCRREHAKKIYEKNKTFYRKEHNNYYKKNKQFHKKRYRINNEEYRKKNKENILYIESRKKSDKKRRKKMTQKKSNENLINLSKSAELIESLSGRAIDNNALRNQIVRGHWTFDAQKLGRDWYLEEADVKKYAKTYHGLKKGRPCKNKSEINVDTTHII